MDAVRTTLLELLELLMPRRRGAALLAKTSDETIFSKFSVPQTIDDVHALSSYRDPIIAALIRELKYHKSERAAALLGKSLSDALLSLSEENALMGDTMHLVPIPLASGRLRERGFNQIELVIAQAEKKFGGNVRSAKLLRKIRDTAPQTTLSRSKRLENVSRVFEVVGPLPQGLLVVIDDVMTTGATLAEAKRALREAGAREVVLVALAH